MSDAEFGPIDRLLDSLVMPYEQWETLYWQRLQAAVGRPSSGTAEKHVAEDDAIVAPPRTPVDVATATR